ncbi:MAG: peroxiredoxin [Henriciella sp.]|uniref:peroxiredoxin n=1 Tax=Henriciella sp. TaxID=1968823 RepID=UPI0032EEA3CE
MTAAIKPGDSCPSITLPVSDGSQTQIPPANERGLVLFFYPKDNTPGCATEAKAFSGLKAAFDTKGYDILGVSRDSLASHQKFIEKQALEIPLASDEDGKACEAFGVWVEKKMYGRTLMGIERSTFLIGADGDIKQVWRKVRVKDHAETVLNEI